MAKRQKPEAHPLFDSLGEPGTDPSSVAPAPVRIAPPDQEARDYAVNPLHHVVLEASAGTGKTTVLVRRYLNLLEAGVTVWLGGDERADRDDVGRVEGELRRRHSHAVAGDSLQASGRDHLPPKETVGVCHRHRREPAGRVDQIIVNRHLSPVWRIVRR